MNKILCYVTACILIASSSVFAGIKPFSVFCDNAVLQRGKPITVFGTGDTDGEKVEVTFNGSTKQTRVDDGKWKVVFDALSAGGPYTLNITGGGEEFTASNIMIGDVWICAGQSNMDGILRSYLRNYADLYKIDGREYANPNLRFLAVANEGSFEEEVHFERSRLTGDSWRLSDGDSNTGFSAAGFFFGVYLQQEIGVPVGLIQSAKGATAIEQWCPRELFTKRPEYDFILDYYDSNVAQYDEEAHRLYEIEFEKYIKAKRSGKKPKKIDEPIHPMGKKFPAGLYNQMIHPLHAFPIKGVIWYQGESNSGSADGHIQLYSQIYKDMVTMWRARWGDNFPFIAVQIANNKMPSEEPEFFQGNGIIRDQQRRATDLENSSMIVAYDIGSDNVHPPYKEDVGIRLALAARKLAYGEDVFSEYPSFKSMQLEGKQALLTFDNVGSGLIARDYKQGYGKKSFHLTADELKGFAVCGADQKWVWADAEVRGKDQVVVSSDEVGEIVAVRYATNRFPLANLFNSEGFPAEAFRTDDFGPDDKHRVTSPYRP